jgi:hypothetical protein
MTKEYVLFVSKSRCLNLFYLTVKYVQANLGTTVLVAETVAFHRKLSLEYTPAFGRAGIAHTPLAGLKIYSVERLP